MRSIQRASTEFEEFGSVLLVPEATAERASNKDIAP